MTVQVVETDAQGKIPCLDGLRAVACLMILTYHFGPHIVRNGGPFSFLNQLPPFMFQGVELFFVLSGFLIGGILLDARHSKNYFRTFYARRAFRLLPVYYLLIAAFALSSWLAIETPFAANRLFEDPLPLWTYWLYLQNFAMAASDKFGPGWLAATWSVAVEEQFYLILPFVVRRVKPESLWKGCVAAWFVSIILRALNAKFQFIPVLGNYVLLPFRLEGLALGILIAYAVRYRPQLIERWKPKIPALAVGACIFWLVYPYVPNPHYIRLGFLTHTGNSVVFALIFLALILNQKSAPARFLSLPVLRMGGSLSYSVYLFHPVLLCLVFYLYAGKDPALDSPGDLVPVALSLVAVWGVSTLSWRFVERPAIGLGRKFQY